MEELNIISTMRLEDFPVPVPGSEVLSCYKCGKSVWLSPATKRMLEGKRFKVLCNRCRPSLSILLKEKRSADITYRL